MAKRYTNYIRIVHFFGDLVIINLGNIAANFLKFGDFGVFDSPKHIFFLLINATWLILVFFNKPYQISRVIKLISVVRNFLFLLGLHFLIITSFYFFANKYGYSKEYLLTFYAILLMCGVVLKVMFVLYIRSFRRKGFNFKKVVIVGVGKISRELGSFINNHPEYGYKLIGYFGEGDNQKNLIGGFDEIEEFALKNEIEEIYCCVPYADSKLTSKIVDFGEENLITVKLITDFREFSFKRMELERYGDFPVINITSSPLDDFGNKLAKRLIDIAVSLFVMVFILSWLTPVLAILIKLESRGPVFFRQNRTGLRNKAFTCYKFRSMNYNGDADIKAASADDPRITRVGAFLRRFSIDEMPQFFNVLIGDMSVIGPRPHMLKHTETYKKLTEKFMSRHSVKPGITGLAQASGYRGEIISNDFLKNRVVLDRFYIENWSLYFDLKIMLLTIRDVFTNNRG